MRDISIFFSYCRYRYTDSNKFDFFLDPFCILWIFMSLIILNVCSVYYTKEIKCQAKKKNLPL